jgi:hypothetical protein
MREGFSVNVEIDGVLERLVSTGEPFTIRDLVAMLERDAADRGLHTTPSLERARRLRDETVS